VERRVKLWDDALVLPPALAARAAVLAFGDRGDERMPIACGVGERQRARAVRAQLFRRPARTRITRISFG
jgi:hypothetical protein